MAASQIYQWGGHLDHATDLNVYLADYKREQAAAAREEELAIYGGETVTVTAKDTYLVAGRVRNRRARSTEPVVYGPDGFTPVGEAAPF